MAFSAQKLVTAFILFPLATAAMAGANSGTIHFVGNIVKPPCATSMAGNSASGAMQMNVDCGARSAFYVSFQRVGPNANSSATISLRRNGKLLGTEEATLYRMAFQGKTNLALAARAPGTGAAVGPVIMTIAYQ